MAHLEEQIDRNLANQTGLPYEQVRFLRREFKKLGRNPLDASVEILAIENGLDEQRVKALLELHTSQERRLDGLCEQKREVF